MHGLERWIISHALQVHLGGHRLCVPDSMHVSPMLALPAGIAGNSLLLPRLKQLPERSLEVQATRQKLLGQVRPAF